LRKNSDFKEVRWRKLVIGAMKFSWIPSWEGAERKKFAQWANLAKEPD
jgi:hypothetical protein